jgi:hypothetical protein
LNAVSFVNDFRAGLIYYLISVVIWFVIGVAVCFAGMGIHRVTQLAEARFGTVGMYVAIFLIAMLLSVIVPGQKLIESFQGKPSLRHR